MTNPYLDRGWSFDDRARREAGQERTRAQAPANYKDPAKIVAYQAEKVEEVYRRQALDSMAGRILTVSYAIDDADPQACGPWAEAGSRTG